jgi:hypothetical protein
MNNLDLIIDALTLALVALMQVPRKKVPVPVAPLEPAPIEKRVVAREFVRREVHRNPGRTAKIAAYLRDNPECKSYRRAAAAVDGK